MANGGTQTPLRVRPFGHDYGHTPMGTHQIAARQCTCEPAFVRENIADVRCPTHGLHAFLRKTLAP